MYLYLQSSISEIRRACFLTVRKLASYRTLTQIDVGKCEHTTGQDMLIAYISSPFEHIGDNYIHI